MKRGISFVLLFLILALALPIINSNSAFVGELKVTLEHPFLVEGEWVSASDLVEGDELTTVDGKRAVVTSIEKVVEDTEVYNIEDDVGINNYVVGGFGGSSLEDELGDGRGLEGLVGGGGFGGVVVHNSVGSKEVFKEVVQTSYRGVHSQQIKLARGISSEKVLRNIAKTPLPGGKRGFKGVFFKDPITGEETGLLFYTIEDWDPHHMDIFIHMLKGSGVTLPDYLTSSVSGPVSGEAKNLMWTNFLKSTRNVGGVQRPWELDVLGFQFQQKTPTSSFIDFQMDSFLTVHQAQTRVSVPRDVYDSGMAWAKNIAGTPDCSKYRLNYVPNPGTERFHQAVVRRLD